MVFEKRELRVGFVLGENSYLGSSNYFKNLFHAINLLPEKNLQPVIFIKPNASDKDFHDIAEIIELKCFEKYALQWAIRKLLLKIFPERDFYLYLIMRFHKINIVSHYQGFWANCNIPALAWIADFQHLHLPNYFSEKDIKNRTDSFIKMLKNSNGVILSSYDSLKDLKKYFREYLKIPSYVLNFVSSINMIDRIESTKEGLIRKYQLNKIWFYIPNQFWIHKNHKLVIEALYILKQENKKIPLIVCSGSKEDPRDKYYFSNLISTIKKYGLEENIKILGTIAYEDVVALMRYSVAVINPSLFEGWSTSVEEAKSMGKKILLSDLDVHREQGPERGIYFSSNDAKDLANKISEVLENFDLNTEKEYFNIAISEQRKRILTFALTYSEFVQSVYEKNEIKR